MITWTEADNAKFIEKLNALKRVLEKKNKNDPQKNDLILLNSKVLANLKQTKNQFPRLSFIDLVNNLLENPELATDLNLLNVKIELNHYNDQLAKGYLDSLRWITPDADYKTLVTQPQKFAPKSGGAKNTGERTGLYTFGDQDQKTIMLIKQGAEVGETIAEYIGGNLYNLTIPDHAAKCILVRDGSKSDSSINDVYVASIYAKAESVKDAFESVGYPSRGFFAGVKARVKKVFGSQESLVRKVIKKDEEETNHTLAMAGASVLFHGDNDFHLGNFVEVQNKNQDNVDKKFYKIDHGFSFFNFDKKVTNIFNPFAGKVVSVSPKRLLKGGKLIEFYPTNHFWDFAVETKLFYFNNTFIKACEDVANLSPELIRENIHLSLEKVNGVYGKDSMEALKSFGDRIGMKSSQINGNKKNPTVEDVKKGIEDFMVQRLIARQASMQELADYCKIQSRGLTKERRKISGMLNDKIIECLDRKKAVKRYSKTHSKLSDIKKPKRIIKAILHAYSHTTDDDSKTINSILKQEIEILKMVQQANDLGLLITDKNGHLVIKDEFYFHHAGKKELIAKEEFPNRINLDQIKNVEIHALLEKVILQVDSSHRQTLKKAPSR